MRSEARTLCRMRSRSRFARTRRSRIATGEYHGIERSSWVLVTGASSGFGEEFARQYTAQGRSLVLVARRIEKLQTLATELRERYRVDVIVEQVDLSDVAAVIQ